MSTAVAESETEVVDARTKLMLATYNVNNEKIAQLKDKLLPLQCDSKGGYEMVRQGIATVRDLRVCVEKTRKKLKEDSLAWGRKVDSEAKRITALLEEIETPLQSRKDAFDAEADRVKKEKMAEIQRKIDEAEAIKRAAEEAKLKAERDAEEARLKAEAERLAEERRQLEIERAAQEAAAKADREKLAEERRLADEERARLAREEEARLAAARAAQEAKDKAERDRIEAEQRAASERIAEERRILDAEKAKQAAEEAARVAAAKAEQDAKDRTERARVAEEQRIKREAELTAMREAMRPDVEKIQAWVDSIKAIQLPEIEAASLRVATGSTEREIRRLLDNMILVISE